ncbi:ATP-grasp domain-containing protein [Salinimicrobium sp. CAU 1759]
MKKLLLLGGLRYLIPVIQAAREQGYFVITCDNNSENPAHRCSHEFHLINILEKEAVLKVAQELQIDGILSFAVDPGVTTAAYVAELMNLPFNGSYKSVTVLQDKVRFREFLTQHKFTVPKAKGYVSAEDALKDIELFKWPVIVKPVDSAGSKGVSKVSHPNELMGKISKALQFSPSKKFIIEEFISQKSFSSDSDAFSIDGKLVVCSFSDQRFDPHAPNPYTPTAYSWPGTQSKETMNELKCELQRLFDLLDLKTGVYNIETREDHFGNAYIMEVSPRGGGNRLSEMLRFSGGVDLITNAVRSAVGDPLKDLHEPDFEGFWAMLVLYSKESGMFEELEIDPAIQRNVIERDLWISKGDQVRAFTGANETVGTLVLRFDHREEMEKILTSYNQFVKVKVI